MLVIGVFVYTGSGMKDFPIGVSRGLRVRNGVYWCDSGFDNVGIGDGASLPVH